LSEKRSSGTAYVPRDESFSEEKRLTFSAKTIYSVLHALVPSLQTAIFDSELGFPNFTAIDSLFNVGVNLPPIENQDKGFLSTLLPRLFKAIADSEEDVLRFETTDTMDSKKTTHYSTNLPLINHLDLSLRSLNGSFCTMQETNSFGLEMRNLLGKLWPVSTPTAYSWSRYVMIFRHSAVRSITIVTTKFFTN
jgi:hypothetical protein